jgi:tetratricopeptide (TPR) repeat protein
MILVQQQKYKEAAEPIDKAIELTDKPKESWLTTQGVVYSNLADYAKLEEILKKLVEMAPQKAQYWTQLAAVQNELRHEHQALATMQLAYKGGFLKDDKALRQLASLLFLQQQPWECAKVIDDAMKSGVLEKNANAYRLISNCYIAAREQDKAFDPLTKAGELSADADMYMLLGQMYLQREKFDLALEALSKGLPKAKPEQKGSVHLLMGISEIGTEKLDAAEAHFKAAMGDQKVGKAAESYLKFIEDKRMRDAQEQAIKEATAAAAAAAEAEPSEG